MFYNQTWGLPQLPNGKKEIWCKWVFTKKEGFFDKYDVFYKARLVAKGYAHNEGINSNEVFSPVVKHSSITILLVLVAQNNMELVQLDVKIGFFTWGLGRGKLYDSTKGIRSCWERRYGLQTEKIP